MTTREMRRISDPGLERRILSYSSDSRIPRDEGGLDYGVANWSLMITRLAVFPGGHSVEAVTPPGCALAGTELTKPRRPP
jgi:hypothetical protein